MEGVIRPKKKIGRREKRVFPVGNHPSYNRKYYFLPFRAPLARSTTTAIPLKNIRDFVTLPSAYREMRDDI